MKTKKSQNIQIGFLLLPGILIFGFFTIYPIVKLFITSFFKWDFGSMFDQEFIGFANYKEVLTDSYFHLAFSNSIVYTLITVPAQMILGLLIAMLINNINKFSISYRVAYYLPVITSWVIASLVFKYVFNTEGLLNYFLTKVIHLTSGNIHWLDSAGSIAKFFYVTIPSIKGTILFALVMLTIGGFNVFTSIKMITDGNPGHKTESVLTWMYYKAFSTGEFGYSAALSFIIAVVLGILAIVQFRMMDHSKLD